MTIVTKEFFISLHDTPNYYIKFLDLFYQSIKISGKSINFEDKKINRSTFYKNKKLFKMHDIDVNKILVSKKESYGTNGTKNSLQYFIGYNDEEVIRPLCIKLNQLIRYAKYFDANMAMSFKVGDNKLLKSTSKYGKKLVI